MHRLSFPREMKIKVVYRGIVYHLGPLRSFNFEDLHLHPSHDGRNDRSKGGAVMLEPIKSKCMNRASSFRKSVFLGKKE
jgi:hypothetical protein